MAATKRWVMTTVIAGALALGWFAVKGRTATAGVPPPPAPFRLALDWPEGTERSYRLSWNATETTRLPLPGASESAPQESQVRLEGELVIQSYGLQNDAFVLGARLRGLTVHEVKLLGQPLPDVETSLEGPVARVELLHDGTIRSFGFAKDAPPLFSHLMQALLTELEVAVPANATVAGWELERPTRHGKALLRTRVIAPRELARERVRHVSLQVLPGRPGPWPSTVSDERIVLDDSGRPRTLTSTQVLEARDAGEVMLLAQDTLSLEQLHDGRFDLAGQARPSSDDVRRPGEPAITADAERRALEQRTEGLTPSELMEQLRAFGKGGTLPDHNRSFARAIALLRLHPELCAEVGRLLEDAKLTTRGRELMLDLLVGAGEPEAQAALRRGLEQRTVRKDPAYTLLFQRMALLTQPEGESAEWVLRQHELAAKDRDDHLRRASAMALGAIAGARARDGSPAEGHRYNGLLREELTQTQDASERAHLVRAIGNAALDENRPLLGTLAADPAPEIRAAVGSALYGDASDEATTLLLGLATDRDPNVAQNALAPLARRPLDDDQLTALVDSALGGQTPVRVDTMLVTALAPYLSTHPEVRTAFEAIVARNAEDGNLQARVRSMLADASPPPAP